MVSTRSATAAAAATKMVNTRSAAAATKIVSTRSAAAATKIVNTRSATAATKMVNTRSATAAAAATKMANTRSATSAATATKSKSQTSTSTSRPSRIPKVIGLPKPKIVHQEKLIERSTLKSKIEDIVVEPESEIVFSSKLDPKTVAFWEKDSPMASQTGREIIVSVSTQIGELQSSKTLDLEASKKLTDPKLTVVANEFKDEHGIGYGHDHEKCIAAKRIGRLMDDAMDLFGLKFESPQMESIREQLLQGGIPRLTFGKKCESESESESYSKPEDGWSDFSFEEGD